MNRLLLLAAMGWAMVHGTHAQAQIEISARLQHGRVLQFEPILCTLRIHNRTPRPVQVGRGQEVELHFDISRRPGDFLPERANARHTDPFTVQPGESVQVVVNLLDRYPLTRMGPYSARARVTFGGRSQHSGRMQLDVVPGMRVESVEGTLTGELGGPRRVCTLLNLTRDGREHLFLRFDDPDAELCYGVHDLGTLIRFADPLLQIDLQGRVHVLHQSAPSRYTHSIFRLDGRPVDRVFYTKGYASIRLETGADGELVVRGGQVYEGDLSVQMPTLPAVVPFR